jgi:hypothetical protein
MLIDPQWQEQALAVHSRQARGRPYRLLGEPGQDGEGGDKPRQPEVDAAAAERLREAKRVNRARHSAIARQLGMTNDAYWSARRAGTLPQWAMQRLSRAGSAGG